MKKEIRRILKITFLFTSLFGINIIVFQILSIIGFDITMTENSYLLPPLLSTVVLLVINKSQK